MMAKTGICSIVVIARKVLFTLHAKKIKPRVQPFFKRLQAPKNERSSYLFYCSPGGWKNLFLGYSRKHCYAYDDGKSGSLIGRIDIETMKIDFTKKISPKINLKG
jgi:hypothetical protein